MDVMAHGIVLDIFISWDRPELLDKGDLAQGTVLA